MIWDEYVVGLYISVIWRGFEEVEVGVCGIKVCYKELWFDGMEWNDIDRW